MCELRGRTATGALDLYVVNHHERNNLYLGDNKGGFVEVTSGPATSTPVTVRLGLAATAADFNDDGPSCHNSTSWPVRRTLLTPQLNAGSLYRFNKEHFIKSSLWATTGGKMG